MSESHRILYVSPVMPAFTGNGLAMRAAAVLEALAWRHAVSLLVVPLYPPYDEPIPGAIAGLCRESRVVAWAPAIQLPSGTAVDLRAGAAAKAFANAAFDRVHVFRLAAIPYALTYLDPPHRPPPVRHLDLDEVESTVHRCRAAIHRTDGNEAAAQHEENEAERLAVIERHVLAEFDRIYVCSPNERTQLQEAGSAATAELHVLPNIVRPPHDPTTARTGPFSLLFVGTLGYFPNEDAVRRLAADIAPALRRKSERHMPIRVVGGGASSALREFAETRGVQLAGHVADLTPSYREAGAVVIPIVAGGGTRIKVLEAFAFDRPVVSTALGVEGLDVRDGEHVLLADDADLFAGHCVRLAEDPELCAALVERASEALHRSHTPEALRRVLRDVP